jgi:hypothetical protein
VQDQAPDLAPNAAYLLLVLVLEHRQHPEHRLAAVDGEGEDVDGVSDKHDKMLFLVNIAFF